MPCNGLTDIKIHYKLSNTTLSLDKLVEEFRDSTPSFDFVSFTKHHIKKADIKASTKKSQLSRLRKLENWRSTIPFSDVTNELLDNYRSYLLHTENLKRSTVNGHFRLITTYLRKAQDYGMRLNCKLKLIETKNIRSNRNYLTLDEIKVIEEYWNCSFCLKSHRKALGYFLFNCYTGLRINEIQSLRRRDFKNSRFTYYSKKNNKKETRILNKKAQSIIESEPKLFVEFMTDQKLNYYIKEGLNKVNIKKSISFHVSRHTFATNYLRLGGKLEDLKVLLGHSKIETTMIYVHLMRAEEIKDIHLFDNV